MTTLLLLDVPQNRTKLEVWKERQGVHAWFLEPFPHVDSFHWEALRWPSHGGTNGVFGYGHTEEEACFDFATKHRLPWLETITQKDLTP